MAKENVQEKIIAEWVRFSKTDAYKDWIKSMDETMQLIQNNVDDMTESRPTAVPGVSAKQPIDSERAALINQRKMGIKYAVQYAQLRINAE